MKPNMKCEFWGHRHLLGPSAHEVEYLRQHCLAERSLEHCSGGELCRALSASPKSCGAGRGQEGKGFRRPHCHPRNTMHQTGASCCKAAKLQYAPQLGRWNVVPHHLEDSQECPGVHLWFLLTALRTLRFLKKQTDSLGLFYNFWWEKSWKYFFKFIFQLQKGDFKEVHKFEFSSSFERQELEVV